MNPPSPLMPDPFEHLYDLLERGMENSCIPGWEEFLTSYDALGKGFSIKEPDISVEEAQGRIEVTVAMPKGEQGCIVEDITLLAPYALGVGLKRTCQREIRDDQTGMAKQSSLSFRFSRSFILPAAVTHEGATAAFRDGKLIMSLPKAPDGWTWMGKTHRIKLS